MPTNKYNRNVQDTLVECWRIFIMSRVCRREYVCMLVQVSRMLFVCLMLMLLMILRHLLRFQLLQYLWHWHRCCRRRRHCCFRQCCHSFVPYSQFIILSNRLSTWFGHVQISPPIFPRSFCTTYMISLKHMSNARTQIHTHTYSFWQKKKPFRSIYGFVVFYSILVIRWISFRFRSHIYIVFTLYRRSTWFCSIFSYFDIALLPPLPHFVPRCV